MYAVIRIRGSIDMQKHIKDTLKMLKLTRVNHCVLLREKDPKVKGMVQKVKDFVTWGEINEKTLEKMVTARGRLEGDKPLDEKKAKEVSTKLLKAKKMKDVEGIKPFFRLACPKKGFEGIKQDFPKGALGYRGEKINDLIERMM